MLCALIIAGGSGKRFWPLSTEETPKQLLKLFSDKSMIRETVDRILPLIPAEYIFVATNVNQAEAVRKELPMLPEDNLIFEPEVKDTAAAIGYSTMYIRRELSNATLVVLASDHLIKDSENFRDTLKIAAKEAEDHDTMVTLGIRPTRPEIGYGYIKVKGDVEIGEVRSVDSFLEKPLLEVAEEYLADGTYLWNSGIFVFKSNTILKEIRKYMPKHDRVLKNIQFYFDQGIKGEKLSDKTRLLFEDFEKISIDYGIMEKSDNIKVIPTDFGWNDIGSFTAFEDVYASDADKNIIRNSYFEHVNCSGNIVLTENLEIKAIGLENLVIVQSGNKLLICDKYEIDDIKKIL